MKRLLTVHPLVWALFLLIMSGVLVRAITNSDLAVALFIFDIVLVIVTWLLKWTGRFLRLAYTLWILILIALLIGAKLPGSAVGPAQWIGVSYLIFRLIHFSIDARHDRVGQPTLSETLVYALHPTSLISGPIDRIQHSVQAQHEKIDGPRAARHLNTAIWRLFIGLFKKVVLANLCYIIMLQHTFVYQPDEPVYLAWLWLFSASLYLYFDFSSYSDLAIGFAHLLGLELPENFANPYLQSNLARFWQAWHITLSTWLRDYIFFPVSRGLIRRFGNRFSILIVFISHLTTMIVCGLWHGITTAYVAWGVWHGIGLFIHSQIPVVRRRIKLPQIPTPISIGLTFLFVTLGWVFFLNDYPTAISIYSRLFRIG